MVASPPALLPPSFPHHRLEPLQSPPPSASAGAAPYPTSTATAAVAPPSNQPWVPITCRGR